MCNSIVHIRTLLNDKHVAITTTTTTKNATPSSHNTNESDYSAYGNDKKGLALQSLGNTYAALPVENTTSKATANNNHTTSKPTATVVDNAWIASDSSGSGSQSDSDDFAFDTYK